MAPKKIKNIELTIPKVCVKTVPGNSVSLSNLIAFSKEIELQVTELNLLLSYITVLYMSLLTASTFVSNKWKITKALNSQKIFQQTFFHKKFVDYFVKNPIVRPPSGERTTSTFSGA